MIDQLANSAAVAALNRTLARELYYDPKCMMLFGDAKESLNKLIVALKS